MHPRLQPRLHPRLHPISNPILHPVTLTLERRFRSAAVLLCTALSAAVLGACIVVPQTRMVYDPDCKMHTRQMTLEAAYLGGFQRCYGDGCVAMLAAVGVVTVASVVVSGSIALVGNVLYWAELQGRCQRAPRASAAGASTALPSAPQ